MSADNSNDEDVITVGRMKKLLDQFFQEKFVCIPKLVEENKFMKEKIEMLEERLNQLNTYTRRNNIVVHNIPMQENESPIHLSVKVA